MPCFMAFYIVVDVEIARYHKVIFNWLRISHNSEFPAQNFSRYQNSSKYYWIILIFKCMFCPPLLFIWNNHNQCYYINDFKIGFKCSRVYTNIPYIITNWLISAFMSTPYKGPFHLKKVEIWKVPKNSEFAPPANPYNRQIFLGDTMQNL